LQTLSHQEVEEVIITQIFSTNTNKPCVIEVSV